MSVTDLCHEYGISRPTAYKWTKRYGQVGPEGLLDLARTPHSNPHATSAEIENEILALRKRFPSWGARKLNAPPMDEDVHRVFFHNTQLGEFNSAEMFRPAVRASHI
jgi:hypothetical protein